jgi:hypothetical protein
MLFTSSLCGGVEEANLPIATRSIGRIGRVTPAGGDG